MAGGLQIHIKFQKYPRSSLRCCETLQTEMFLLGVRRKDPKSQELDKNSKSQQTETYKVSEVPP